ncbi:restriction endonuclease [Streptomyces tanashiensis]|uniref:restriction endonuclease n=1 Tax=Streptomyces tanashiensis TaxID=67367 RepID=UPI0033DAC6C3
MTAGLDAVLGPGVEGLVGALAVQQSHRRDDQAAGGVVVGAGVTSVEPEPDLLTYRMKQLEVMSPTWFEHPCAEPLAQDGLLHARRVGGSGDLGAEVIATDVDGLTIVIQCKQLSRLPVNSPTMQRLDGLPARSTVPITLSSLASTASHSRPRLRRPPPCDRRLPRGPHEMGPWRVRQPHPTEVLGGSGAGNVARAARTGHRRQDQTQLPRVME